MLGSRLFRLECSLSPKVKTLDILSIVCRIFFSRERECEVNFIICFWTFEINNSWTSETADAHSFFGTGIFFGGRQGCIFYLAYKTSDASWPLSFSAKRFVERQSWVTWDQVANYSNNFEIIVPETHFQPYHIFLFSSSMAQYFSQSSMSLSPRQIKRAASMETQQKMEIRHTKKPFPSRIAKVTKWSL